jgi:hypothetical protein
LNLLVVTQQEIIGDSNAKNEGFSSAISPTASDLKIGIEFQLKD